MNPVAKFTLRAVLSLIAGYYLSRLFLGSTSPYTVVALSGLIVFLSYTFEYMRRRT